MSLEASLYRLLVDHNMACYITMCIISAIKAVCLHHPKKPPDPQKPTVMQKPFFVTTTYGLIACSSTLINDLDDVVDIYSNSFDAEDVAVINS